MREPCPRCGAVYSVRTPACRCNPELDNYQHRGVGWLGVVAMLFAIVSWGLGSMLSIWLHTSGLGRP